MQNINVQLLKPAKQQVVEYPAELIRQEGAEIVVRAVWMLPRRDLGYMVFETGDLFTEHYYTDRWYNIHSIRTPAGELKGYYCNIARPAHFDGATLTSEDLEIDLFVSPDRSTLLRLDMDEFAARDFEHTDPATYRTALATVVELERMARAATPPFGVEE